eukprot:767860-Hanusia_phi.AAC.2
MRPNGVKHMLHETVLTERVNQYSLSIIGIIHAASYGDTTEEQIEELSPRSADQHIRQKRMKNQRKFSAELDDE